MNNANVITVNLKRLMDEQDISAQKLSYDARIPASRVSQILRGRTKNPTIETVSKLAKALDVSIDDLVADHGADDSELSA